MITVQPCTDSKQWNEFVLEKGGHPLQLWGWGQAKAQHGWHVERIFIKEADEIIGGAQVLTKRLPGPLRRLLYVPRGPVVNEMFRREVVLDALTDYGRELGAVAVTIEPDWTEILVPKGWRHSKNTILIPQTLVLDLTLSEDELLEHMTKKTRQYIRKSGNEALVYRQVKTKQEIEQCLQLYRQTAERAGFSLHDDRYYHDIASEMGEYSPLFAAFNGDKPVAFLWLAISQSVAFELYGGMDEIGQDLRANYALKWYAVRKMREWGIERYDVNGLLNDGVSTFKRGFANHETALIGTYDYPLSPLYAVWSSGLPLAKKVIRSLRAARSPKH